MIRTPAVWLTALNLVLASRVADPAPTPPLTSTRQAVVAELAVYEWRECSMPSAGHAASSFRF